MKKYKYQIFQTNVKQEFAFVSWRTAAGRGWSFDLYHSVWSGEDRAKDDLDLLEYLYMIFNEYHPNGFNGHSLSVSDIVKLHSEDEDKSKYYYCDSFGWVDITANITEKMG